MKRKTVQLFLSFIILYFILHVTYLIPDLIHNPDNLYSYLWNKAGRWLVTIDCIVSFLFVLIPYLILTQLYTKYNFSSIIIALAALPVIFIGSYYIEVNPHTTRLKTFFLNHLFYDLIYVTFGIVVYFLRYSHYQQIQQKEILLQNKLAELSFLRSQVNPHFLFNSLNNLYALVYKQSDQSLKALSSLSELLRYMLYGTDDKVILQKELDYIGKYLELQKLRFEQDIKIDLNITGNPTSVLIPPLLLIPFVENSFKHGNFATNLDGIIISIFIDDSKILFDCVNKIGLRQKDFGGGIGLKNVKRRLELLYPGKHELSIKEEDNYFIVQLEINYA